MVTQEEHSSAGKPAKIILTQSKGTVANNWDDVTFITATIVDEKGIRCANADHLIQFSITDSGKIIAVDNGNIINHDGYQGQKTRAYQGKAIAIIKAAKDSGSISIKADVEGLTQGTTTLSIVAEKK